jgi:hypothetical protein
MYDTSARGDLDKETAAAEIQRIFRGKGPWMMRIML